jgi:hypothetical protein
VLRQRTAHGQVEPLQAQADVAQAGGRFVERWVQTPIERGARQCDAQLKLADAASPCQRVGRCECLHGLLPAALPRCGLREQHLRKRALLAWCVGQVRCERGQQLACITDGARREQRLDPQQARVTRSTGILALPEGVLRACGLVDRRLQVALAQVELGQLPATDRSFLHHLLSLGTGE